MRTSCPHPVMCICPTSTIASTSPSSALFLNDRDQRLLQSVTVSRSDCRGIGGKGSCRERGAGIGTAGGAADEEFRRDFSEREKIEEDDEECGGDATDGERGSCEVDAEAAGEPSGGSEDETDVRRESHVRIFCI